MPQLRRRAYRACVEGDEQPGSHRAVRRLSFAGVGPDPERAAARQREAEDLAAWLAARPGVEARCTSTVAPEQWEGTVDGHAFSFRGRHGSWQIEIDLADARGKANPYDKDAGILAGPDPVMIGEVIAEGAEGQLGADAVDHVAFIVRTIRFYLRGEQCDHAGALEYCPACGQRMREAVTARPAHEVVAAYWAAAEARDWAAFGALLADDVVYRGPQAREQVRGRAAYLRFNAEGFAYDWHLSVQRIVGDGSHAASWIEMTEPGGKQPGLCFFDLDADGRIAAITDFWPEPCELPASRAHLVERY